MGSGIAPAPVSFALEARGLSRRFGDLVAVDNVTLAIHRGEFFALLGPSGCGKTTLLRIIAGLEVADAGELWFRGRPMLQVPPHQRPVNTVFQAYALFPHLSVRENVAFGLRMKGVTGPMLSRKVTEALQLTRVEALADRRPAQLSGGQMQRVALARALVNEPEILLLDEPLAALDLQLRRQLQSELRELQRRTGVTFVFVTHDQEEALALSDRIAVMRDGRIEQAGPGETLYRRPRTRFIAEFLGACNVIEGRWAGPTARGGRVDVSFGQLEIGGDTPQALAAGAPVILGIRPEQVQVRVGSESGTSGSNEFQGQILQRTFTGAGTELTLRMGDHVLRSHVVNGVGGESVPGVGASVRIRLPPEALVPLEPG